MPSITSQGELIGCCGPIAPPSLSVPWVPTPARVLTFPSNRSIYKQMQTQMVYYYYLLWLININKDLKKILFKTKIIKTTFRIKWFSVSATYTVSPLTATPWGELKEASDTSPSFLPLSGPVTKGKTQHWLKLSIT